MLLPQRAVDPLSVLADQSSDLPHSAVAASGVALPHSAVLPQRAVKAWSSLRPHRAVRPQRAVAPVETKAFCPYTELALVVVVRPQSAVESVTRVTSPELAS